MASIDLVKQLREETGIAIMDCKKALEEANGDIKRAREILREKGKESLKDRSDRSASQGLIETYIHAGGKIGVMLHLASESDFVARSDEFKKLAHEICLQIAAAKPLFVSEAEISPEFLDGERKIYQKQMADSGKPAKIIEQVVEGKLRKYKQEVSLLSQPWVKDTSKTINDLLDESRRKIGERIEIIKFIRYEI
ncbi:MAG: translation elongation factor Ts [Candidatus Pacebacteria bacterium]|nr:translation elongation factor Ts [Candidatus Paceibacterota bacterium]